MNLSYRDMVRLIHPDVNPRIKDASIKMSVAAKYRNDEKALWNLAVKWGLKSGAYNYDAPEAPVKAKVEPNPSRPNPSRPNPSRPNPSRPNPSRPNPAEPPRKDFWQELYRKLKECQQKQQTPNMGYWDTNMYSGTNTRTNANTRTVGMRVGDLVKMKTQKGNFIPARIKEFVFNINTLEYKVTFTNERNGDIIMFLNELEYNDNIRFVTRP